jgi:SsrA-binding protein
LSQNHIKILTVNKKARFNYFIEDEFEAGVVLKGTEVKSLREGRVNITDSYAALKKGEVFIYQLHIGMYPFAHYGNHEPLRPRKLLLHKQEIKRLYGKVNEKGFSLIPLKVYFKGGKVKISLGLAKGKKQHDKRETIKNRDAKRELDRMKKEY